MAELRAVAQSVRDMDDYRARICDCVICAELLRQGGVQNLITRFSQTDRRPFGTTFRDYPTAEVHRLARYHFLNNRYREIREANASQPDQLLRQLEQALQDFQPFLAKRPTYLRRWGDSLRD